MATFFTKKMLPFYFAGVIQATSDRGMEQSGSSSGS